MTTTQKGATEMTKILWTAYLVTFAAYRRRECDHATMRAAWDRYYQASKESRAQ